MDGEAMAHAVEHGPQGQLRLGVPAADPGHDFGALFRSEEVGHGGVESRREETRCKRRSAG